ncbi:MAG: DUF2442 domain-containing protein [Nodosilinea sp.]
MTSSRDEIFGILEIQQASVSEDLLTVKLSDGRLIAVPLAWYPRLLHGTPAERKNYRLTGGKAGIHWPELDEDISLKNILLGQPSGESQSSLQQWLRSRSPNAQDSYKLGVVVWDNPQTSQSSKMPNS